MPIVIASSFADPRDLAESLTRMRISLPVLRSSWTDSSFFLLRG